MNRIVRFKTTRAENPIDETQKEELEKDRVKISKRKNGEKRKKKFKLYKL